MNKKFGYYITKDNPKVKIQLESRDKIKLDNVNLIELVLPSCKIIFCRDNFLKELIVPEGCEEVYCSRNKLVNLVLPESCKKLYCFNNKLTKLILPKNCTDIVFFKNKLHKLIENLLDTKGFNSINPIKIQLANNLQRNI